MRVLIVDDEPLARGVLRAFLQEDPDITRIEECGDGKQAVRKLANARFDLLFLDVQMPDIDGFGVLSETTQAETPIVIFVTAFEEHAVRAFTVAAVDYLLKPFDDRRFAEALQRAKQRHRERELTQRSRELVELLGQAAGARPVTGRSIAVQSGSSVLRVDLATVQWVEAQDKHVIFHTDDDEPVRARQTLSEVEQELDAGEFLRVHRSCIVALSRVTALEKTQGGAAYVVLDSGARVVVSRSRLPMVRTRIQGGSR